MTNFVEDDNVSSSSSSPTRAQEPRDFIVYGRFPSELRRIRTRAYGNRSVTNCSPAPRRINNWNVVDDDRTTSADEKDDIPAFNPVGLDHVLLCIVKCYECDFDIEVSLRCDPSEEFDANNMICPVCNEKLGEDAIRTVQNSSFGIMHSRAWSALNLGNEPALRGNKHETMFGSALSASQDNLDGQSFNDFSSDEDDRTNASDVTAAKGISIAKSLGGADAPKTGGNEQDVEERTSRAAYFQELVMSALFSE
ncbi:unnamed protein product [Lathyrus oleraceus]|uniref:Uncharacterized protein n=1 Tax=Pisum sativum TaxID=3888 RepID=A0A9D4WRJ1_PEA|nr:protein DEHYDRATION-INDUCED 19 homolog 4-like [Pisum sativum]XP_050880002.1 protein DEHYDRATION-INDUCED 19 homolog 4-like [Pisum sativum]XP_050880003.1 protein DEHYDRATION-INDUCED 19 homolog 4-like [Pisum sativum]XP_050880004.1 protein DEHYDRATION-INDUCED 19 homolog 4-like [Pisum sativum]KAI5407201.1 hypothetical protein KIW84_053449 [Pisum sativum]